MPENKITIRAEHDEENGPKGKNLVVNAAVCDARKVSEETLAAYDDVTVNAAAVLTTKSSRELLHRYNVVINAADVTDVPEDADLIIQNGSYTISAGDEEKGNRPAVLVVNGELTVEKGAEKALSRFVAIQVNGKAAYPQSLEGLMGALKVNGARTAYPDDAMLLKSTFVVDKVFIMRAKGGKYYAEKRVVMTDPSLDIPALAARGASFITETAVIAEPLLEAALPLFPEETEAVAVPAGCVFINGDAKLTESFLRKTGGKAYVRGSLTVPADAEARIGRLEFLRVTDTVLLPGPLAEVFAGVDAEYGDLVTVRGHLINDKVSVRLDRALLERCADGVTVTDCVEVRLTPDIPPELIIERLALCDCVNIHCSPDQRSAVEQVSEDVVNITDEKDAGSVPTGGLLGSLRGNTVINAASYTL